MTNVIIFKNKKGEYTGFSVSGHSGYASSGKDIVCSAISTLSQSVCVGLENVLNQKPNIKIDESTAYLSCDLQKNLNENQIKEAQILLKTFKTSVELIILGDKNFKKYINLEVKDEIY